jgi:hypothetical protein
VRRKTVPMQQPVEVDVDESQEVVERVAAIDVAKATGMVCTRVPHQTVPGKRVTKVWEVKATTKALAELADHLVAEGIERTILESTSDYWRAFYYMLEGAGLEVWLVNAAQAKNVPGRPKSVWNGSRLLPAARCVGHPVVGRSHIQLRGADHAQIATFQRACPRRVRCQQGHAGGGDPASR